MSRIPSDAPAEPTALRLLCVEDSDDDIELIKLALKRADPQAHYLVTAADDARTFAEAMDGGVDVVLCDYNMPRFSPAAALRILGERASDVPLVLVTHAIGEDALVQLMRDGAKDYVTKDKLATLPQVIARELGDRHRAHLELRRQQELASANSRLRELSSRVLAAQERERAVVSRELDDVLGQTLTATVIHLYAARSAVDRDGANAFVEKAVEMAKSAVEQVRNLSVSLRPPALDLLGLGAAVRADVERLATAAGLQFQVTLRGAEPNPPDERALVALRLVQEAVTNTIRHGHATRVWVRLRFTASGHIALLVADNGVGFDKAAILGDVLSLRNLGLQGMIERAELVGGHLQFRTRTGAGVIVRAIV